MEKMNVLETISQQHIKPSSPTPDSLKSFKISIFDQLYFTTYYVPFLFFYPSTTADTGSKLASIEASLSKTLTQFYPLAGRIKDFSTIDCNDQGVLFIRSKVSCAMLDFLKSPKNDLLNQLLPCGITCKKSEENTEQLIIQANAFECGGIALGICFLHKIIDGTAFSSFIKHWADISRENQAGENICLGDLSSSVFPPNLNLSAPVLYFSGATPIEKPSSIKRYIFDRDSISSLKLKIATENLQNPTRVEMISGFLWRSMNTASNLVKGSQNPSKLAVVVNIRRRLNPPLPDFALGNLAWRVIANDDNGQDKNKDHQLSYYVDAVRKSIKEIDSEFLDKLKGEKGFGQICSLLEQEKGINYVLSSMCRMGLYEVDFGWGKPLWVTISPLVKEAPINFVFLIDTKYGDGIEAWIKLDEDAMLILDQDVEFRAYAKLNPDMSA